MDQSPAQKIQAANAALITGGNLDAIGEFFAPDYVAHLTEREMAGHNAIRRFLGMLLRGFPDLQVEVEILIKGQDRVAWQRTLRGVHKGDFMGST